MQWSSTHPNWQRDYYSMLLMETLRTKSLLVPFCSVTRDHDAQKTGTVVHTEVYDTEPNWNPLAETDIWLRGAHLDSRTVSINLAIHGDILKFSDYSEIVQFVNRGDMDGLVRHKIGQNQVDYLDILARNAFLTHPNKVFAGGKADRGSLLAADIFDVNTAELIRTHLEENEIPGVANPGDNAGEAIVCITTPRVIHDIRVAAGGDWKDAQYYEQTGRKFTREVGMWGGVRFIRTNRMRLRNAGAVDFQGSLAIAASAGDGAAVLVDVVYAPGQSTSTRYIEVQTGEATNYSPGDYITIHATAVVTAGDPPPESDGTQETRRIVSVDTVNDQLALDKPLLKDHLVGDYVTKGIDIHSSVFIGGPGVVYAIGEDPHVIQPPKTDDLLMVNRYGWRGFMNFQMFRPEYFEVVESAGTTD
jgi:N4-gp56 family major capsid protein